MKTYGILLITLLLSIGITPAFSQTPVLLADINPGSAPSNPRNFTEYNGKMYFAAYSPAAGTELWVTDGTTSGTRMFKDINPGPDSAFIRHLKVFKGKLYFAATDGMHGIEPWVTDGTDTGTHMLKDMADGWPEASGMPYGFTEFKGKLFFYGLNNSGSALWVTDGTEAGTYMLNPPDGLPSLGVHFVYKDQLYFPADKLDPDKDLWRTNGSGVGGAGIFHDPSPTTSSNPTQFTIFNNRMYYVAFGPSFTSIWSTDGTPTDIQKITLQPSRGVRSMSPTPLMEFKGRLYFSATTSPLAEFNELWSTDGTDTGTHLFCTNPFYYHLSLSRMQPVVYNERYYYPSYRDTITSNELYSHDGTDSNSVRLLKDINPNAKGASNPGYLNVYNNRLMFVATDGTHYDLWTSDGTDTGTHKILPAFTPAAGAIDSTTEFFSYNGSYYYAAAYDTATGIELYKLTLPPLNISSYNRLQNELILYPVPTSNTVTISLNTPDTYFITLLDITGRVLNSTRFTGSKTAINMVDYPPGIYLLKVHDNKGNSIVKRIPKQ